MSCLSGLCTVCPVCLVCVLCVLFVWSVYCVSCLSGLGVICLVCLGCLSILPTSYTASVLCTCISMYFHVSGLTIFVMDVVFSKAIVVIASPLNHFSNVPGVVSTSDVIVSGQQRLLPSGWCRERRWFLSLSITARRKCN